MVGYYSGITHLFLFPSVSILSKLEVEGQFKGNIGVKVYSLGPLYLYYSTGCQYCAAGGGNSDSRGGNSDSRGG